MPGWGEAGERRCARGGAVAREGEADQNHGSRDRKKKWEGDGWGQRHGIGKWPRGDRNGEGSAAKITAPSGNISSTGILYAISNHLTDSLLILSSKQPLLILIVFLFSLVICLTLKIAVLQDTLALPSCLLQHIFFLICYMSLMTQRPLLLILM